MSVALKPIVLLIQPFQKSNLKDYLKSRSLDANNES